MSKKDETQELKDKVGLLTRCVQMLAEASCNCDDGSSHYMGGHYGNCCKEAVEDMLGEDSQVDEEEESSPY